MLQLEVDATWEHIVNRFHLHQPLLSELPTQDVAAAGPKTQLVQSLAQIWENERVRRSREREHIKKSKQNALKILKKAKTPEKHEAQIFTANEENKDNSIVDEEEDFTMMSQWNSLEVIKI